LEINEGFKGDYEKGNASFHIRSLRKKMKWGFDFEIKIEIGF